MPQAMRLGLSSNMTWPMDASVLCLKRSIYLFLAFANIVCLVTNHYSGVDSLLSGVYIMEFLIFKWEAVYEFRISCFDSMLND